MARKGSQHHIPSDVKNTIKDVLNCFKFSAVSQSQLKSILELRKERFVRLVSYHNIRWLSLSECIQRLTSSHTVLCEYFERKMHDKANRRLVRIKCEDLLTRLRDPKFLLYVFFLKAYLSFLSEINVQCQ